MSNQIKIQKFKKCVFLVLPMTLLSYCTRTEQTKISTNTPDTPEVANQTPTGTSTNSSAAETSDAKSASSPVNAPSQPLSANSTPEGLDAKGILSKIHDTNQMEINMGELAKSHGEAKAIKDFGNTLVKDHSDADKKVLDVAKKESITLSTPKAMNEIEKQKMQEHQELMGHLHVLKGAEFDKVFTQAMVDGHNDTISFLESSNSSDANVKALVSDILPTVRKHERTAELISQELKLK